MSTFHFSPSKIFLQLLVPIKFSIFIFGRSFKVNSYVEFIFFNKNFQKNSKYYKNHSQNKIRIFLTKREFNIIFILFMVKNSYLICVLLKNSRFF